MARAAFEKTIDIAVSPAALYAALSDPMTYARCQPLVVALDIVAHGTDENGCAYIDFTFVEQLRVLGINFRSGSSVRQTMVEPGVRVRSAVSARFGVHVDFEFRLESAPDGVHLVEWVTARAPWPLKGFVTRQADAAQTASLANLKRELEAASHAGT